MNKHLGFVVFPLLGAAVGALVVAPQLVHMRDGRQPATVTVQDVLAGTSPSREVELQAVGLPDRGLKETITTTSKSGTKTEVSFYMPLIDPAASPNEPTQLVLYSSRNELFDAIEAPNRPLLLQGTVRDVLWEGLPSDVRRDLEKLHPVAPTVKLLDTHPGLDHLAAYGGPLLGLVLGLFLASKRGAPAPEA